MESRRDYRKLMQIKKRNKNYAKLTILASLGLGVALANSTTTHAEENREWKANTSTTIKSGDTEYTIKWGDTLSLISRDSGITMDTLAKLNNILNQDLIFEGNVVSFGNGATANVRDAEGNVIAETPLTQADKDGIKEAQNNNTATNNTNNSNVNSSSSTKNNGTATDSNNTKGSNSSGAINTNTGGKGNNGSTNGNNNGGNTTKPVNPIKPVDPTKPIKPVDPIKPQEKEFTITINHVAENGEVLSKETRKAKENTTIEAKSIDFTDRGYELVGESTQTINVKQDTTVTFTYKKIDDTKPVENKVNVKIEHIGDDGKVLATETRKAEKDSTVKADAKDFTAEGYVLNDELTKQIVAVEGANIIFNYRKVDTPTNPTNEDVFITKNIDVDGNDLGQNVNTENFEKVSEDTKQTVETLPNGNTITTHTTTIIWKAKDVKPYEPVHTESNETRVVAEDGTPLGSTIPSGYTEVSRSTVDDVKTQPNGDTHTTHITTIVVKKDYVPKHTESTQTINVDTNGNVLSSTNGYTLVSEVNDGGKTTTASNGDTHTTYTITKTWKKDEVPTGGVIEGEYNGVYYGGLGNSGMTFATQSEADEWAFFNNPTGNQKYNTWEVRMAGTNEIRITLHWK